LKPSCGTTISNRPEELIRALKNSWGLFRIAIGNDSSE